MIRRLITHLTLWVQPLLPQSLFGRLFGLVALAVLASHLLFTLQLSLRENHRPGFDSPEPRLLAEPRGDGPSTSPAARGVWPPPGSRRPGNPREVLSGGPYGAMFWLGLAGQCLLVLGIARWGSRMLTQPIEQLAEGAIALGENLQIPALPERGPIEARLAIRGFNQMQIKLKHQLAERSQFLLAVSHDLRTPLTRMRLRYEQLPEGDLQQKLLHDWKDLSLLVDSTLDYVRGQEVQGTPVVLDVEALLSAMVEDRQDMGQDIGFTGTAKPIATRPEALRRCLQNLLDNAIAYGRQAQMILEDSDTELSISVRDFGLGIPESELGRVLEPFVRLEASRNRHTGGLGLGLSIARDSARAALGRLSLSNHPEGGLVARIQFAR